MSYDLELLAKKMTDIVGGKGGVDLKKLAALLTTESGKKVLSMLLADGGESVKRAAGGIESGDASGVKAVIERIASTKEGAELLAKLSQEIE